MICFKCNCEDFVIIEGSEVEQEINGKITYVYVPLMACKSCGWRAFGPDQIGELFKQINLLKMDKNL